ncbi:MAG: metal ABC transporter ATP-binding protein [Clostridia bacterium]|nr:metal ABC transporter ATP-binding protein [Clostridia bacterium]
MKKVIEAKHLSFGYDNKLILENINFSIDKGDYLGIIGSNGSGKSTLIKLLLATLKPSGGEIKILGERIDKFRRWDKIGYVSQKANSFNTSFPATVEEVVAANLYSRVGLFRRPGKEHRKQVDNALELVGMREYKSRLIGELSGGQQQRVFIARVLVSQPEIMFLDEPTVGIDAKSEEAVYCMLARLNKELGITIVLISHDTSAITVHANKIACMGNKGLIIHDPKEKMTEEFITELYGYGVNLHAHRHDCRNCIRKEVV